MNKLWEFKRLDDICELINGLWIGEKPPFIKVGVFRNINFRKDGLLDDSNIAYLDVEIRKYQKRRLLLGDLILEKSGGGPKQPVGRVALYNKSNGEYSCSNFTAALRVKNPQSVDYRYLHKFLYWIHLSGITEKIQSHSTGIRNLDVNAYKRIEIPMPQLPEQRRIVAILDEAFAEIAVAKASTEKNLNNAKALFESYLQSVFNQRGKGWVEKAVDDIADHLLGKMLDKAKNRGTLQLYLRNINVRWFAFDLSNLLEMRFLEDEYSKCTIKKGDVIICEGGYPGRAAIWNEEYPIYFQKALHRVRFYKQEYSKWFVYYLYSQEKSGELKQYFTGTGILHFTGEALGRFKLPLPPLSEVPYLIANIDDIYAETQRLVSLYQKKLAALDELKRSLLHRAFNDEL